MATPRCSTCRKLLPEQLFPRKQGGGLGKTCRPCLEKRAAKRRPPSPPTPEPAVLLDLPAAGSPFAARLLWADALGVLAGVERPDLIVTDPPYGSADREQPDVAYAVLALAIQRLRPGGRIYVFGDRRRCFDLEQAGGPLIGILEPLIWDRGRRADQDPRSFGPAWELISVGERLGDGSEADREAARSRHEILPDLRDETIELFIAPNPERRRARLHRGRSDVEAILRRYRPVRLRRPSQLHPEPRGDDPDPTRKPVELLKQLVAASSRPHDLVLDPFAGRGGAGVAALELGRRFLGIEVREEVAREAASALRGAKRGPPAAARAEELREGRSEWPDGTLPARAEAEKPDLA